jgi:cytochrome P450
MLADSELKYELSSGEFYRDPYPFFARHRDSEPVFYSQVLGGWILLQYEHIDEVLRNHEIYSSRGRVSYLLDKLDQETQRMLPLLRSHFSYGLAHSDAPEHRRLRSLLAQAFTPKFIDGYRPEISEIVNRVIKDLGSEFDLIADVFTPIPALVVGKLLGSSEKDIPNLIRWAGAINGLYEKGGMISAEKALYAEQMLEAIREFVLELVDVRRHQSKNGRLNPNTDVISGLVNAESLGDSLSEAELVSTVVTLFVAGHETTTHLMGNGFFALFNSPDQFNLYQNRPELAANLVDEMARFDGSVPRSWRINKVDVEIASQKIPANSLILPMLASANRDPKIFEDPESFKIERDTKRHLAFGKGVHVCLGAPLARIEGQEIIQALNRHKPNLKVKANLFDLQWREDIALRGLVSLPASS